ncbi:hypothetical protein FDG50_10035 [Clostridium botulinum]|uniref:hypothetical protein n=1 Tax=Clostridium botulinum TaxID=1491 RepID=UPI0014019832|nr:hypothetical protein [Clostridium botulinum]MBY6838214.1 hypothetical protein [Clostridium botulinum]NFG65866.1 hypothetical protein [Clostridium botulinum]NFQ24460.1 hypothetical protein [Clostridium botulinum]
MQNRYVADVGDFSKYGLLRNIAKTNLIIGINWYLTSDESGNEDGKHISYLQKDNYRKCDEELYYSLNKIILENKRNVYSIEKFNILPNTTIFYDEILDFHKEIDCIHKEHLRKRWHLKAIDRLNSSDIVFLDPDNGLQVKSTSLTSKKGNKYIGFNELEDYFNMSKSIIFYNHRERKSEEEYLNKFRKLKEIDAFKNSTIMGLKFRRGTIRDYIFILQPQHVCIVKNCCNLLLDSEWKEHFSLLNI